MRTGAPVLSWGISLLVVGTLFILVSRDALNEFVSVVGMPTTEAFEVLRLLITVVQQVALPLGAALVGAGIVLRQLHRRLDSDALYADRPTRMFLPRRDD